MSGVALNTDTTLDLWATTLSAYEWTDKDRTAYLAGRHDYPIMRTLMTRKVYGDPGTDIAWQVIYDDGAASAMINDGEERTRVTQNVVTTAKIGYAHQTNNYTQLAAEIRRNKGEAKLKNLARIRRETCLSKMAADFESYMWQVPDASGNKKFNGIPYYIVPITTTQVAATTWGHQGYCHATLATCANIASSATAYARWANFNDVWSNSSGEITETDAQKLGRMFRHLHWRAPMIASQVDLPEFKGYFIGTDETIVDALSLFVRKQRDDLESDATRYYGAGLGKNDEPMFKMFPVTWVEDLDTADATNRGTHPLYMISLDDAEFVIEKDCDFRELVPMNDVTIPDAYTTHVDLSGNLKFRVRQSSGMISHVA